MKVVESLPEEYVVRIKWHHIKGAKMTKGSSKSHSDVVTKFSVLRREGREGRF